MDFTGDRSWDLIFGVICFYKSVFISRELRILLVSLLFDRKGCFMLL